MGALVAVRQWVGVGVVEQRVVSVSPGKFLEGEEWSVWHRGPVPRRATFEAHLGADAQVRVGHELWRPVGVSLHLHVGVDHADGDAGDSQHGGEDLPGPRCGEEPGGGGDGGGWA